MKLGNVRIWLLIAAFGVLAAPRPVQARLGETKAQCNDRYGVIKKTRLPSGDSATTTVIYEKNGLEIICEFKGDKCIKIAFQTKMGGDMSLLPLEKAMELIKVNSQDAKWSKPYKARDEFKAFIQWSRSDGGWANFNGGQSAGFYELDVYSPDYDRDEAVKHMEDYRNMSQSGDTSTF